MPKKIIVKLVLISLLWIISINSGILNGDTLRRLQMSHAWLTETAEVSHPDDYQTNSRLDPETGILGVGGKRYLGDDVGQAILMLPGDWLGIKLNQAFPQLESNFIRRLIVNFFIFIPLNLLAILACFWLLKLFDFNSKIAGITSITLLLGTTVLHYAQVHQHNNQLLLLSILGYANALAFLKFAKPQFLIISGLASGFGFLIRSSSIIHCLTIGLFSLGGLIYHQQRLKDIVSNISFWLLGLIPSFLTWGIFNYIRFGNFFTTGQSLSVQPTYFDPLLVGLPPLPEGYPFIHPFYVGIWGVLFSPSKSIFIYDPLLLPCSLLTIFSWKRFSPYIQLYLVNAILNLFLHLVLTAKLDFWHGEHSWGARYHVTSVHLLLIPLIALLIEYCFLEKKLMKKFLELLLILSFCCQISSVILRPIAEQEKVYFMTPHEFLKFRLGERLINISCLLNHSLFNDCDTRLKGGSVPLFQRISLLPFNFTNSRIPILIIWGFFVFLTMITTIKFYYLY